MKRFVALIFVFILFLSILSPIHSVAANTSYTIDSVLISPDGTSLLVSCTVPDSSENYYYLFRTLSENENINELTPIANGINKNGRLSFSIEFNSNDHSSALYGYCLAISDGENGYLKVTNSHYIDNFSEFAHNGTTSVKSATKKGLEVQYITDAQLLGIGHTVIHVYLNELISEAKDNAHAYVYGDTTYYLDTTALTLLDYRVKTLSEAGINVYINFLLAFDTNAKTDLYYPNASGGTGTLFAPNISSPDTLNQYASAIHHIAERYSSNQNGFCGNYIIGYEVNNQPETNSAGIKNLTEYANEYGRLLRISYLSLTSAYEDARIYASISNRFNAPISESNSGSFGAKEFLDELFDNYSDVPFGIAINAYPSSLSQTDFWNDPKATDSTDTDYITMKNIGILTDHINSYNNDPFAQDRHVVVSEFGLSGVKGEQSELMQAAAYAYAYYIADNNPYIDALIWHRHVDHSSEIGLNYGIYASSEITLDASEKKLIHDVMGAVDSYSDNSKAIITELLQYLPISDYDDLVKDSTPSRIKNTIFPIPTIYNRSSYNKTVLFDFSKNLYSFYPTDNTEYIDMIQSDNAGYMRIAAVMISSKEYVGAGASVSLSDDINNAEYLTVSIRVVSRIDKAEFALVLSDGRNLTQMSVLEAEISTNQWITLTFPLSEIKDNDLNASSLKLWVRSESSSYEQIFIDVSDITLLSKTNNTPRIILTIVISAVVIFALASVTIIMINRYKSRM